MLWSRVQTSLAAEAWFEEAAARDYALVNLGRPATREVPSVTFGGNAMVSDWTLGAKASAKRLRSPRTWREEAASGLFVPVSAASRWVAEADVRLESSPGRPVRLEVFAGFFDDGDGESLAFRPPVRAGSTLRVRRGAYTAAVELEAWGRSPVTESERLPGALLAHMELGRSIGKAGRLWVRWQNVTDDPAPLWPFVDSSRSSVLLGWDFRPASVWEGSRERDARMNSGEDTWN